MDSSIPDNHFHGSNHAETNLLPHLARSPRSVDSKFFSFFFFYIPSAHRRIESWRVPPVVSVARSLKIPGGIVDLLSSTLELPKWLRERERKGGRGRERKGYAARIASTRRGRRKVGYNREGKRQVGRGMRETHSISILSLLLELSSRNIVPYIAITSDRTASLYLHDS